MSEQLPAQALLTPALIEALEANFTEEMASFGRGLPGAILHEDAEISWFYTGRRHLNGVLRSAFASTEKLYIDRRIREVKGFFQKKHVSMGWAVGPSARPAELGKHLEEHGFKYGSETPGMALAIAQAELTSAEEIEGFEIREALDEQALLPLLRIEQVGFGATEETAQNYYDTYCAVGFGPGKQWHHYLGWLHGEPVATTSLLLHAGLAGIYGVATIPEARRKGIATALTKHALREAGQLGYEIAVLSPSELSERIYQRIGFKQYCTLHHYGWTPS